ncbi:SCP2 sterol-binding domain-containing protein [Flavobacteriaceae bacterium]|jgi:putative sterol carrier protein|nr:SCP2 sterol-binding domain-containing protein [Flavobacteriaceae bacterium]MDB2457270.1 SCP2 sterol-binding domain-containing protein [Flavobacteriaceae bacterium]MDB4608868.1 SCP2 sterol-binding domain-containing protein [Flavobacteriaceae bacterium]MDB4643544.1 SCP2 sterol-binding domain-containing protein [Flavobacteriaceae bacterium]
MSNEVFEQLKEKAEGADAIGGTLKFEVGDLIVFVDGSGNTNIVSQEDNEADCTISTTAEVLIDLKNGDLNPMMAVMGGKIKISGDMGLAMKVQSLLG